MDSQKQGDQEIPRSTDQSRSEETVRNSSEQVEEIDVALAGDSDDWETDDEGDFYTEGTENDDFIVEEDEDGFVDMGLPKHVIQCYPTTTAEEVSVTGILCDICLNEYKSEDQLRTIPCLHRFHTKCIDKWLKKNSKCPMCRSDLTKSEWYTD